MSTTQALLDGLGTSRGKVKAADAAAALAHFVGQGWLQQVTSNTLTLGA